MNFRQLYMQPEDLPTTFHAAGRPSVNLHLLFVWPGDLLYTSVNFPCGQKSFCQLSLWPGDLPYQLLSTFHMAYRPSVNFPCCWKTFHQLSLTFHAAGRPSINFRQVWVPTKDPSTFVYFPCGRRPFRKISVRPRDILSTSVYIPCGQEIFCQLSVRPVDLPSTFRAVCRHSVNFHPLSLRPKYLPSDFLLARRLSGNFRALTVPPLRRIKASPSCVGTSCVTFACVYTIVVRLCK